MQTSFEYICLLHTTEGTYELYGNDGNNTHSVPEKGDFNEATRDICNNYVLPEQRESYYENANMENVLDRMNKNGGSYSYRYSLKDGVREAEFYWYEPTHTELLMTVKRISQNEDRREL